MLVGILDLDCWAAARNQLCASRTRGGIQLRSHQVEAQDGSTGIKGDAWAGALREVAQELEAVLLAVHWSRIGDVPNKTGDLSGKVVDLLQGSMRTSRICEEAKHAY